MPFALTRNTFPFADRLPRITEGSVPSTRFSATELLVGWSKTTLLPLPIEKDCQLIAARSLVCVTVSDLVPVAMLAWPATTSPPVGSVCASTGRAAIVPARLNPISHANRASPVVPNSPPRRERVTVGAGRRVFLIDEGMGVMCGILGGGGWPLNFGGASNFGGALRRSSRAGTRRGPTCRGRTSRLRRRVCAHRSPGRRSRMVPPSSGRRRMRCASRGSSR